MDSSHLTVVNSGTAPVFAFSGVLSLLLTREHHEEIDYIQKDI